MADRMLEVLMAGVSTRKYGRVIGEMADTVGVSKSAVSRETVEASERVLKESYGGDPCHRCTGGVGITRRSDVFAWGATQFRPGGFHRGATAAARVQRGRILRVGHRDPAGDCQ